ncbi:MAG: substrate-binding domain-containing protein, partial [Victivallaceae bacterium]
RYLLSLNHRKIGFIGGKFAEETFQQRWTGYEKALVEAGIKADERFIRHEIMDNKESYLAAMDFFRNKEIPSAIVCDNDLKAWGVMDAVKDSGLTVPGDVSVIGFDNITACTHMAPPLTTVEHPRKEIGYQGGKLLLKIIKEKIKGKNLEIPIRLIKRKSCRKI